MTRNLLLLACVACLSGPSPLSAFQAELPSLEQAVEVSKATGKPILAMAGRNT